MQFGHSWQLQFVATVKMGSRCELLKIVNTSNRKSNAVQCNLDTTAKDFNTTVHCSEEAPGANCHNITTATATWGRRGSIPALRTVWSV